MKMWKELLGHIAPQKAPGLETFDALKNFILHVRQLFSALYTSTSAMIIEVCNKQEPDRREFGERNIINSQVQSLMFGFIYQKAEGSPV